MRPVVSVILGLCVLFSAAIFSDANAEKGKSYGKDLSKGKIIPISQLMKTPEKFLGKTVKVQGRIVDVCKKRGCWMELASDVEFQSIIFKVNDGVMVFPMQAKSKMAIAEGEFVKLDYTLEETIEYKAHQAEEAGEEFDASTVTEPMVIYRINGLGAQVN